MAGAKRKILVCGATGFIGRNIAERLARDPRNEVTAVHFKRPAPDVKGVIPLKADLTRQDEAEAAVAGKDIVIQAAATTSGSKDINTRPYIHVTDNAVMNSLLFRSAYDHGVKHLVFFSCTVMYQSSEVLLKETDFNAAEEIHPRYFGVGWTKVYLEKMAEFYSRLGRTRHTIIRHSNIYGPHDKFDLERSHVFGASMTKVLTSTNGTVPVWGTGMEARDLLYVDDLVDFVESALDKQTAPYELVNVGSGKPVTVADLVARIIAASGKDLSIVYDPAGPSIQTSLGLDCSLAKSLFGWEPKVSLDDGIAKTMRWWRDHYAKSQS